MRDLVNSQASAVERRLSRSLASTYILAQEVRQNLGMFDGFELYADEILQSIGGVSNLQLAPDGIIRYIHPLAGNEKAIGHDILKDDRRRKEALLAVEEHHLTLAGPFELVQGGVAVIGRNPVYLPSENGEKFWGFASALIFLEDLLKVTELDQLENKGYRYELLRQHPDTGVEEVFAQSVEPLNQHTQSVSINVPNSTWRLVMSRPGAAVNWRAAAGYLTSLFAGLLLAWILFYFLQQPEKLKKVVKQKTEELASLAFHDHLTGLANRRLLSEQLAQVLRQSERYGTQGALLYLDLDDFKRVNDSMGHDAGDLLLEQIAKRLSSVVRDSDIVSRLGGDEFGVLLLDANSVRNVGHIAEKLIEQIEQPVAIELKQFVVSCSIGIAMIPADGADVSTLLRNADLAMYAAKHAGKHKHMFFDPVYQQQAEQNLRIEHDLCSAVENDEFVLHYQPLLDMKQNVTVGYEALVRWQHPEKGLIYPDQFIGIAEETGKIIDIGYWVIREACEVLKVLKRQHGRDLRVAVNLSPRQFRDPNLLDEIRNIVRASAIEPTSLEIEITESTLMDDVDDAVHTLQQLQKMGISIAIDDFGTGYSSFALLKRLPVDKLKIDRSFVMALASDSSDQKIVRGLVAMAHTLGIKVVAEGIETSEQHTLLKRYRCDFGQGYLFGRPEPIVSTDEEFTAVAES
ncbi:MAG: EAL domain-containing protein [Motiliproteus sp.]